MCHYISNITEVKCESNIEVLPFLQQQEHTKQKAKKITQTVRGSGPKRHKCWRTQSHSSETNGLKSHVLSSSVSPNEDSSYLNVILYLYNILG